MEPNRERVVAHRHRGNQTVVRTEVRPVCSRKDSFGLDGRWTTDSLQAAKTRRPCLLIPDAYSPTKGGRAAGRAFQGPPRNSSERAFIAWAVTAQMGESCISSADETTTTRTAAALPLTQRPWR